MTPAIYQEYIEKKKEIRATFFGSHVVAVEVNHKQRTADDFVDWKNIPYDMRECIEIELPKSIYNKSIALLNKLGIVFGCLDFIIDKNGDYVFIEINQGGQFLWIEELNPDIKMLDRCIEYIINGKFNFNYSKSANDTACYSLQTVIDNDEYKKLHAEDLALANELETLMGVSEES